MKVTMVVDLRCRADASKFQRRWGRLAEATTDGSEAEQSGMHSQNREERHSTLCCSRMLSRPYLGSNASALPSIGDSLILEVLQEFRCACPEVPLSLILSPAWRGENGREAPREGRKNGYGIL